MRYIPLKEHQPDEAWTTKANKVIEKLKAAPDDASRKEIIEKNSRVWRELKDWLLQLSHGKCWFSEARDVFSHWDVEHFRPKDSAVDGDGVEYGGYWWLAFDWQNYRICGNVGNRKKSTYFPLRKGSQRATKPSDDLRYEAYELLDPADPFDPSLLSFNVEGRAIPSADLTDGWDKERVVYSVERLNLDFPPLMAKRKMFWEECWRKILTFCDELAILEADDQNMIARNQLKETAREIREMMHADKELSMVARACVLSSGDSRITSLLHNL